ERVPARDGDQGIERRPGGGDCVEQRGVPSQSWQEPVRPADDRLEVGDAAPQLPDALREFVQGGSGARLARGAGVRGDLSESTAHLIELPENLREVGAQGGVPRDGPERALLELAGEPVDLEPGEGELRSEVEQSAAALVGEGVEHAYAGKQGVERSAEGERLVRQRVELGERRAADRISGSEYRGIRAAGIDVDDRVFEEAR